jgi:GT2 family glycosyltransferase
VPTRNRSASLHSLIFSLESAQAPGESSVEIVTVNNGSSDDTGAMLEQECAKTNRFPLRVLNQERPGKSQALNTALAHCDGDLIIILDDDVSVDSKCLIKHVEAYHDGRFTAVQGRVLPGKDPDGRSAASERIRQYNIPYIDYGDEIREIRGLTGTNMSFKRQVFEKVGFFDTRLGPGAAGFSEDTEYSIRIRKAGFKIGYTPHAVVYHELNPNRYGREYNRMVEYRKGVSRSIYRHDSIVFRVVPDLLANCFRYGLYRGLGNTQKAYKTEGRILKCWGYLMGKWHGIKTDKQSEV